MSDEKPRSDIESAERLAANGKFDRVPFIVEPPPKPKPAWREAKQQTIVLKKLETFFDDMQEATWDLDAALGRTLHNIRVIAYDNDRITLEMHVSRQHLDNRTYPLEITASEPYEFVTGARISYALGHEGGINLPILTITP